ncbi:MAG: hypothetical protein J6C46_01080 [Clostridia bacterium]|nr:hypothetical protein [Clostridia bacterium]
MKIQHWAIIFVIIILPISIICRNVISKKNLLLRDETRYNNIIDNATYDAVAQIVEVSEGLGYGKNVPITQGVANAAIDRFFNTLSVNFNLPTGREYAESYFCQYIPAIIIVGYDGLYIYSYEPTASGYEFVLKPKIPYATKYKIGDKQEDYVTVNFTLDNYVKIYFPDDVFLKNVPDENGKVDEDGTHILEGYVADVNDVDRNGIRDDAQGLDDPFYISGYEDAAKEEYIVNTVPMLTDNLSYVLKNWAAQGNNASEGSRNTAMDLGIFYNTYTYRDKRDDVEKTFSADQDYIYDADGKVAVEASEFNLLRRETIINLITSVMKEEFNEHNMYVDTLGITYDFNIPDIAREIWNNTIDDVSVLAFMQGMPVGADSYYNNYSLGGARIVQASYLYGETVKDEKGDIHHIYHKDYCRLIPRDENGYIIYDDDIKKDNDGKVVYGDSAFHNYYSPDGKIRKTTYIEEVFINEDHAHGTDNTMKQEYFICSECM